MREVNKLKNTSKPNLLGVVHLSNEVTEQLKCEPLMYPTREKSQSLELQCYGYGPTGSLRLVWCLMLVVSGTCPSKA